MQIDPALSTLSRLLDEAMEVEPDQLEAWLAALPAEHAVLAARLRVMLRAHRSGERDAFIADGPRLAEAAVPADDTVATAGDIVGPYRLIREIGRGGMGAVWLAERVERGGVQRQVALKLPRLAWGAGLAERMARERDIGARLEHPNIARLYDAGVDSLGRPFLALEYIDGQPLDAWCDAHSPGVRERLQLFLQVVRAVAYAHGRLVVHRDLKPSNVLVSADGQAHLLDFGIAKMLHEGAPGGALTQEQGRVLTPHYASPEQLRGGAITVASDVYSLGMLLYELLTGAHPYQPEGKSLAALEQAVLDDDAPSASSRVPDQARAKALRGEIDAILAKALARDPGLRYATADALAEDLQRHLDGERVLAQPDSLVYRMTKALHRHRLQFGAAAAVLLAALAGTAVSIVQARRANDAAERAHLVKEFVVDVFKVNERGDPANNELRQLPAELLLEHGAKLISTRFPGQPQVQAELYGVVGRIFGDMGSARLAAEYATRQVETLTLTRAGDNELARAMLLLAESLAGQDQLADAALRARRALELSAGDATLQLRARIALTRILIAQAHYDEARLELDRVQQALEGQSRPLSLASARVQAEATWRRAVITGDFSESAALFDKAIEAAVAAEGPASRLAAAIRIDFAYRLASESRGADAIRHLEAALVAMRTAGGADDIGAALAQSQVTAMLFDSGQIGFADAFETVKAAQQIIVRQGPRVPAAVRARIDFDLGWILRMWGDVELAYALQSEAVKTLRPNAQSPFALQVLETSLGLDAMETGRHQEADELLRRGLEWRKINSRDKGVMLSHGYISVAWNLLMQGHYDEAEHELAPSPPSRDQLVSRAQIRLERGDARGALELLDTTPQQPANDELRVARGRALCATGRPLEGLALLEETMGTQAGKVYENSPALAHLRSVAGACALAAGQRKRAAALAELSRRALAAQAGVSPYYQAPLLQLESALNKGR